MKHQTPDRKQIKTEALDITHPKKIDEQAREELEAVEGFLSPEEYREKLKQLKIERLREYKL